MARPSPTNQAYGRRYRRARAILLADNPPCHWCGAPATTADHEPPLSEVGHPHMHLVPACKPCNLGHRRPRPVSPSREW